MEKINPKVKMLKLSKGQKKKKIQSFKSIEINKYIYNYTIEKKKQKEGLLPKE